MMTRRHALKIAATTAIGTWLGNACMGEPQPRLKLGVASISLSQKPPEEVIRFLKAQNIHYVSLFRTHCPWNGTAEECRAAAKKFTDAGLTISGSAVIDLPNNEAAVRKAFENASAAGLPMMVCTPARDALPMVETYVKKYDIRLGIHNHGPGDKHYPSPYDAWKVVQPYDKRIGLCIDVGHSYRAGTDPAEAILKCHERLYDIHMKDSLAMPHAKDIPAEVGQGHMDIKGILDALIQVKYQHIVAFEYEKHGDIEAGLAQSIAYVRKLLMA